MKTRLGLIGLLGLAGLLAVSAAHAQNPLFQHPTGQITAQVVSCYPPQNFTHLPLNDSLVIQFTPATPINPASLSDTTFVVQAQQSGWHRGTATYDSTTNTITFKPTKPFFVGELVTAVATKKITWDSAGQMKPIHGFAWQFYGKVTKLTRATFRDTAHLNPGGNLILNSLADMDGTGNIDFLYEHVPGDIVAFNNGDGILYQNTILNIPGNMFPADYKLKGLMDIVIGYDSAYVENNMGDRTFNHGSKQYINLDGEYNQSVYLDFDGIPEIIGGGLTKGRNSDDTINIYSVVGDSIIRDQLWYVGSEGGSLPIMTGDFNN
ncbi:MAG: Ig-like domain-containing protein, partial [Gloeomargaritales cyanobacterium]